ncbi:ankyrin repeat domain-containing protein [Lysobacter sp. Hz 25]|uniref:ankyrin repeat domain-containing protein n=1 Tax=Lysobacter sp. Hz 25 TaxID=3383698 RepID=UPI0038D4B02D
MHIVRSKLTRVFDARWAALVLLVFLVGCLAPSSPGQQSSLPVASWFPGNPKAQALAVAAEHGNVAEIRRLMKDEGVNPDKIFSKDGYPLLAWPVITNNPDGLKGMLENGANPNARFPTPIIEKFKDGSESVSYENNAMVFAAKANDPIYLKLLLDHGGDPNTRNSNSETLMLQAFLSGNEWESVKLLVERGADINARSQGSTILQDYAGGGGFMQAYWLLEKGANPTVNYLQNPATPNQSHIIDAIFWHPGNPEDPTWQRKCQQWLLQHGYKRTPMPDHLRSMRKNLGFPYEERDVPLL